MSEPDVGVEHVLALLARSPVHRGLVVQDVMDWILPPLRWRQYVACMSRATGELTGFAAWAFVNEETHEALLKRTRPLRYHEWRAGEHIWVTDFVAPGFGKTLARVLRDAAIANGLGGRDVHFLRRYAKSEDRRCVEYVPELHFPSQAGGRKAWPSTH